MSTTARGETAVQPARKPDEQLTTAKPAEVAADVPGVLLDTSKSTRVPILMDMVAEISRAVGPGEALEAFARGMQRIHGPQGYVSLSTRGLEPGEYKITRLLTDDVPGHIGEADPWHDWSRLPVHRDGFLGRIVRNGTPQAYHHLALRDDPVVGDALADFGSLLAMPLFDEGRPVNWSITLRPDPKGFSLAELEETILRANLGGAMVKNSVITRQLREAHAEIEREVEQIAAIQQALLPRELPKVPGLDLDVSYRMFGEAGGDMYVLRPLRVRDESASGPDRYDPDGPWGMLIADVSGHGPAAAVVMAMMLSIIDTYPREPQGPTELLDYANAHLCAKRIQSRFVTAFLAIYDPAKRRLTYSRAGHNPPVWMRHDADGWHMERLDANGGVPLGILDDAKYDQTTIRLEPGDAVVLYTDGITESMSPEGRLFGVEGIEGSLTECTGYPQCAIDHISGALEVHQGGRRPSDDQTVIVMRVE